MTHSVMFNKLKQFKDIREKAKQLQQVVVEGQGAWGRIKLTLDGTFTVRSVSVDESLLTPGSKGKVENGIKEAVTDAVRKAAKEIAGKEQQK